MHYFLTLNLLEDVSRFELKQMEEPDEYDEAENKLVSVDVNEDEESDSGEHEKVFSEKRVLLAALMKFYTKRTDTRPKTCANENYSVLQESNFRKMVTVIILVNEEHENYIFSQVASIANKTNENFLSKVIIFIYGSANFSKEFFDFWPQLNEERSLGFVVEVVQRQLPIHEARNHAVDLVKTSMFVFFHARLEMLTKWLEPLMVSVLIENSHRVAVLAADETEYKTNKQIEHIPWHLVTIPEWSFVEVQLHELNTEVRNLRQSDPYPDSSPIRTPLFLWSMFAMGTDFYRSIGGYDTSLKATYSRSGEDVEFASRVWRCGGDIYVIPCSKITQSNEPIEENLLVRRAEMDYNMMVLADNFGLREHEMFKLWNKDYIHQIINVSDTPKFPVCEDMKPFRWFLDNLVPEMWDKNKILALGPLKLSNYNFCVDNFEGFEPRLYSCHGLGSQRFIYLKDRLQIQNVLRKCLEVSEGEFGANDRIPISKVRYCNDEEVDPRQQWVYHDDKKRLVNKASNKCLAVEKEVQVGAKLVVEPCDDAQPLDSNSMQSWQLHFI